ncbi:MAG TPA: zf-HC2 domain-containing protein [Thermoanaerobaculia bacterium]|nr:zf-HC2 domain-containing protein [Thermoanaerobaculia bacterium]
MPSSSDPTDRLRAHLRGERDATGRHPPPERIAAYHERRLSPGEADEVREHLAACPDCTAELLDLADLLDDAEDQGAQDDPDAAWQRQRSRLFPREKVAPLRRAWTAAASLGLAAALLAIVALAQWRTIARLSQPQANPPLVNLEPAGAARQGLPAAPELRLAPEARRVWVILNPEAELDAPGYDVEVVAPDGRTVLRFENLQSSEAGNFRLDVPGSVLQPGEYRILLFGKAEGGRQAIQEFKLSVRRAPPAAP